jgi:hypothetical protein
MRLIQIPEMPLIEKIGGQTKTYEDFHLLKGIKTTTNRYERGDIVTLYPGIIIHRSDEMFEKMDPRYMVSLNDSEIWLSSFICDGKYYTKFPFQSYSLTRSDILGPGINHSFHPNCKFDKKNPIILQDENNFLWILLKIVALSEILPNTWLSLKYAQKNQERIEDHEFVSKKEKEWKKKCDDEGIKSIQIMKNSTLIKISERSRSLIDTGHIQSGPCILSLK